jgi:hypothetical protein
MLGPRRGTTPQRTKKIFQGALDSYSALSKGYRVALTVQGAGWKFPGAVDPGRLLNFGVPLQGSGPYQHNDVIDRPAAIFGGRPTVHTGGDAASWLQLPIVE